MDEAELSAELTRFFQDDQAAHDALINDPFAQRFITPADLEVVVINAGGVQMQVQRIKATSLKRVIQEIARGLGKASKEIIELICDEDGLNYCWLRQIMSDASLLLEALQKAGILVTACAAAVNAGMAATGFVAWLTTALLLRALDQICQCGKRPAQARAVPA